jgi:chemotaxis protein MotB
MSTKRKEEEVEEEVAPFWMISFSDLMTLLLSFFVILFSLSTIEEKKMSEIVEAMGARYLRGSAAPSGNKAIRADPMQPPAVQPVENPGDQPSVVLPELDMKPADRPVIPSPVEPSSPEMRKKTLAEHTVIPFKLESTELGDDAKSVLAGLARRLRGIPNPIMIKGHASNHEVSRHVIDDLAYERAWNVREYLVSLGLEHKRFSLVLVGANEPLDRDTISLTSRFGDVNTYVEVFLEHE